MNSLVLRSAIVAALGGLLFGYDTAVISGAEGRIQDVFGLSDSALGFTVATALIGTIAGALLVGRPVDRLGRKKVLFAIAVLYVIGALGSAVTPESALPVLWIFRFIGGLGVGAASVTAPIYTAEVAPPQVRGRLVGLVQFNIVLGILLAYLINFIILQVVAQEQAWRWMLGVMTVPAVIFFLLLFTVPESPRWLLAQGRREEGAAIIRRLNGSDREAEEEIADLDASLAAEENAPSVKFFTAGHRKVILLAMAIAAFNQLSGINAVLYYAPKIFEMAGAGTQSAFGQSVIVGLVNLVATMAALTVIDKIGRRKLMIVGSIGYIVALTELAIVFFASGGESANSVLVLGGLIVFIAAHAFGQGAVIWVFISEIFPNRIRGRGQSLGSLTHWVFAAIVTYGFPVVAGIGGGVAFLIFAILMVGQFIWVLRVMPETKGVPLEEMERELGLVGADAGGLQRGSGPAGH